MAVLISERAQSEVVRIIDEQSLGANDFAAQQVISAVTKLRELSPLYEMVLEGVDLSSVEWQSGH